MSDDDGEVVSASVSVDTVKLGRSDKRKQKREEKAKAREAHEKGNTKELRALCDLLQALPAAVPCLAHALASAAADVSALKVEPVNAPSETLAPCPRGRSRGVLLDAEEVENLLISVEKALRIAIPYRELPTAFGPATGKEMVAGIVERPPKYHEKYADQEVSLLVKIWALAGGRSSESQGRQDLAIIDIGAGNGCLALLAAIMLDAYAVLVDHTLPPAELRVEDKVPEPYRSRIIRVNGDVADIDISKDLVAVLAQREVTRAVVIAKHLCGVGTDLALDLVRRWRTSDAAPASCRDVVRPWTPGPFKAFADGANACDELSGALSLRMQAGLPQASSENQRSSVEVVGAIFATCCGHKIGEADREVYARIHTRDEYLASLAGGSSAERVRLFLTLCTRCVAWRTTAGALQNRIMSSQVRAAELFEDALQQPRLNLLGQLFPAVREVVFVDAGRSPQNRCLLAGRAEAVALAAAGGQESPVLAALAAARDEAWELTGGPLDLKPRGFVSKKYAYDGR